MSFRWRNGGFYSPRGLGPLFCCVLREAARCACLQGSAFSPPRRAGLAPLNTAEQAAPDRPVHGADFALGASFTSNQACLRHAVALAAQRLTVATATLP